MTIVMEKVPVRIALTAFLGASFVISLSEAIRAASSAAKPITGEIVAQNQPAINGNCNAVGNGNSNCSVIINPGRLRLSDAFLQSIISNMPAKKPVVLQTIGSQEDQEIGSKVQDYLTQNGYNVTRTSIGMLVPPPSHKATLRDAGSDYELTIAPSVSE